MMDSDSDCCFNNNEGWRATLGGCTWGKRLTLCTRRLFSTCFAFVNPRLHNLFSGFVRHDALPVDGPSWDSGRISCLVYEVKRGTKPVAEITIRAADLSLLKGDLEGCDVSFYIFPRGEAHVGVWLYKHPHLLEVVKHMIGEKVNEKVFEAWIEGKAFGYSEDAIAEFVADQQMVSLGT